MVKRIGKYLYSFIFVINSYSFAEEYITLSACDMNGQAIAQAVVGVPFILEVNVVSQDNIPGTPHIAGLNQWVVEDKEHVSTINSLINGVRSTKKIFQYQVRADKPGSYTIGPAEIVIKKNHVRSNTLTVRVMQQQEKQKSKTEPFLQLLADKKQVVIGEPIELFVRFYPLQSTHLDAISELKSKDFSIDQLRGPTTGSELIDGQELHYLQWRTTLYPKKTGSLTIPALTALYKAPRKGGRTGLDLLDELFHGAFNQKQIFSNALTMDVSPVPASDKPIIGVGHFTALKASVDHDSAKEGEGIVYTLMLEGEGDLHSIEAPALHMPEGLKYYESKSSLDEHKKQKIFEYIIQGVKQGIWEIPAQECVYFDFKEKEIKTLKTLPISVTIKGLSKELPISDEPKEKSETSAQEVLSTSTEKKAEIIDLIMPINVDGPWQAHEERSLSWRLFVMLFAAAIFVGLLVHIKKLRHTYYALFNIDHEKKNAFQKAQKVLLKAKKYKSVDALSGIFVLFIAQKQGIPPQSVSDEIIQHFCVNQYFTEKEIKEWQQFYYELLQYKFFDNDSNQENKENKIFERALVWLKRLNHS
jgi:hypothetical protein